MAKEVTLQLSIRKIERGFVAMFRGREAFITGDEYAALAPADLRQTVDEQIRLRLNDMIECLNEDGDA